jgi:hypothetical protein
VRYNEIITEGRDALLYHGYGNTVHLSTALSSGKMAATSTQRFWADGRRRTEQEPDYRDSYWMKGVSFTRNMRYAMAWGWAVIAVNQAKLVQRTKVIPFSWNYHMAGDGHGHNFRQEHEEFAIVKATKDNYKFPPGHEREGEDDMKRFLSKDGQIEGYLPLTPILEGIWLHADLGTQHEPMPRVWNQEQGKHVSPPGLQKKDYYQNKDMSEAGHSIEQIIAHPKFKGYYVGGKRNEPEFKIWPADTPRENLPPRD